MALRLRVVSEHRRSLGDRASIVFGVGGGTIGRSADNDWVLPDPQRYVSAHHARVSFRQNRYFIEDLSTNGVYVNDATRPIGRHAAHPLQNGDLLRIGDYHVVVAIEADTPQIQAMTGDIPVTVVEVPTSIHALHPVGRAVQTDIGASLNLDELLMPDTAQSGGFRPVNAYGQAVAVAPRLDPVPPPPPPPSLADDEDDEEAVARRIARLAKAVGRDPRNGASAPALYDVQSGLQAFCRGAGIDCDKLPGDAQTRIMHLIGQLFREALVGLKDLERSRNEIRNRFRIEMQDEADDPRPTFAKQTIDDLMLEILQQHESRRLDAVQWLRDCMAKAKDHENATAAAMRAAFNEFIGRLDPAELEARFERTARRNKLRAGEQSRYWELYREFYRNLAEMPADHLPHTFVEAFATAYKAELQKSDD
jgi:type VI secretion system FHA domain protein